MEDASGPGLGEDGGSAVQMIAAEHLPGLVSPAR